WVGRHRGERDREGDRIGNFSSDCPPLAEQMSKGPSKADRSRLRKRSWLPDASSQLFDHVGRPITSHRSLPDHFGVLVGLVDLFGGESQRVVVDSGGVEAGQFIVGESGGIKTKITA
ncbi:MAG: hypothetical protein ACYCTG_14530, partial [Ferrimicrobium sp.]